MKIDPKTLHEEAGELMRDWQFIPETGAMCRGEHLRLWFEFRRIGRSRAGTIGIHTAPPVPDLHFRLTQAATDGGGDNVREALTDATGSAVVEYLLGDLPCGAQVIPQVVETTPALAAGLEETSVVTDSDEGPDGAIAARFLAFSEKLQAMLRGVLGQLWQRQASLKDATREAMYGLQEETVLADGGDSGDPFFEGECLLDGNPCFVQAWVECQGLKISVQGPKELVGTVCEVIIAEEKPELVFQPFGDQAWARVNFSWDQADFSPEMISKFSLKMRLKPAKPATE